VAGPGRIYFCALSLEIRNLFAYTLPYLSGFNPLVGEDFPMQLSTQTFLISIWFSNAVPLIHKTLAANMNSHFPG
jgi:hypothetical protein